MAMTILNSVSDCYVDAYSPSIKINWTVSNASYTHSLEIRDADTVIITITGITGGSVGTSIKSIPLTTAQKNALLTAMSANSDKIMMCRLYTYQGGTVVDTYSFRTMRFFTTANNSSPVISNVVFTDVNAATTAVTGDNTKFIQKYSSLQAIATVTYQTGATLSRCVLSIGQKRMSVASNTVPFGTISIGDENGVVFSLEVTDSRGYTATWSAVYIVYPFSDIQINDYSVRRLNSVGETVALSFSGRISPLIINTVTKNSIQAARFRYKLKAAASYGSYINITPTVSGNSFSFDVPVLQNSTTDLVFDDNSEYDLQINITDELSADTETITIPKGKAQVEFRDGYVNVNGDLRVNGSSIFGFVRTLTADDDLNSIVTTGRYAQPTSANASAVKNYPVTYAGYLEVVKVSDNEIFQEYTSLLSHGKYIRSCYNDTWETWRRVDNI